MKKTVILLSLFALTFILGACNMEVNVSTDSGVRINQADRLSEAYWKTPDFDGINSQEDFWSDLFLWEDGTGCFRFSQATPAGFFYGIHDEINFNWALTEEGKLSIIDSEQELPPFSATLSDESLSLTYVKYSEDEYVLERSEMPAYGSQWTLLSLYGVWSMDSFSDVDHDHAPIKELGVNFASEITIDRVLNNHFWLVSLAYNYNVSYDNLLIGYYPENSELEQWQPYTDGSIWPGSGNDAWYIELSNNDNNNIKLHLTFANDKLLLKKEDSTSTEGFPYNFTAEYGYVGSAPTLALDLPMSNISSSRYVETVFAPLISSFMQNQNADTDFEENLAMLISSIKSFVHIENEDSLRELTYSLEEPLRAKSDLFYSLRDLNSDDIPEFIIFENDGLTPDFSVKALFTLVDAQPHLVSSFWSRKQGTITENGSIYVQSSNSYLDNDLLVYTLHQKTGALQIQIDNTSELVSGILPQNAHFDLKPLW